LGALPSPLDRLQALSMSKAIDLTNVWEKYKGQWVAFDKEYHVLSADKDAKKALQKAKQKGFKRPLLFHMPHMPHKNVPYFESRSFTW